MKNFIAIFVFFATTFTFAQAQTTAPDYSQATAEVATTDNSTVTTTASPFGPTRMAEFPGGVEALEGYLNRHASYTTFAKEQAFEGAVTVQFVVNPDGTISNPVAKGTANELLVNNAIATIKQMPAWNPALQNGRAVKTKMAVKINYSLK
ncbi:MAG: energy transducer TonB [Bacteroidota bacterium]